MPFQTDTCTRTGPATLAQFAAPDSAVVELVARDLARGLGLFVEGDGLPASGRPLSENVRARVKPKVADLFKKLEVPGGVGQIATIGQRIELRRHTEWNADRANR